MPRQFEQVDVADQVGLDIGVRVFDRIAHPGLGPQVDDAVDPLSLQRAVQRGEIGEIDLVKGKPPAMRRDQPVQPVLLQADLVIIVEIVDPHHFIAAFQQAVRQGGTDEPGNAGNQNAHGNSCDRTVRYLAALISWLTHGW